MPQPLISPNLHVVLIHYPLALLLVGVLIEVFSFLWRRSTFRVAGRWMILLGTLSAVPTVMSGLYALWDVVRKAQPGEGETIWREMNAAGVLRPGAWHMLVIHAWVQSACTALALVAVVVWLGASDLGRRRLHVPLLLAMVVAVGGMMTGAWYSGESVYTRGAGVQIEDSTKAVAAAPASSRPVAAAAVEVPRTIEAALPPLQMHVILAGCTVALAAVGIGLSFRATRVAGQTAVEERVVPVGTAVGGTAVQGQTLREEIRAERAAAAAAATPGLGVVEADELAALPPATPVMTPVTTVGSGATGVAGTVGSAGVVATAMPGTRVMSTDTTLLVVRVPTGRFWALAILAAILTFAAGVWFFIGDTGTAKPAELWGQVQGMPRRMVHVINGGVIAVLAIVLMVLSVGAPRRRRGLLTVVAALLVLAIAVQAWVGTLMLYDQAHGPVTGWNK